MNIQRHNKTKKAYKKINALLLWLNKHFPEDVKTQPADCYKFIEAEDFLTEKAHKHP